MKETCKQTLIEGNVQNTSTSQPFQVQDKKKKDNWENCQGLEETKKGLISKYNMVFGIVFWMWKEY